MLLKGGMMMTVVVIIAPPKEGEATFPPINACRSIELRAIGIPWGKRNNISTYMRNYYRQSWSLKIALLVRISPKLLVNEHHIPDAVRRRCTAMRDCSDVNLI